MRHRRSRRTMARVVKMSNAANQNTGDEGQMEAKDMMQNEHENNPLPEEVQENHSIAALKERVTELIKHCGEKDEEIKELTTDLCDAKEKIQTHISDVEKQENYSIATLEEKVTELIKLCEEKDEKIKELKTNLCDAESKIQQEIIDVKTQENHSIATLKDSVTELIKLSGEKDEQIKELTTNLFDAKEKIQLHIPDVKMQENHSITTYEEKVTELINLCGENDVEIKKLTKILGDAKAKIQQEIANVKVQEQKSIAALEAKFNDLFKVCGEKNQEIKKITTKICDADAKMQQNTADVKGKLNELIRLCEEKDEEYKKLTTRLCDAETKIQQDIADVKMQENHSVAALEEKINEIFKIHCKVKDEEIEKITTKLCDAESKIQDIVHVNTNLEKEILYLKNQYESLQKKAIKENELLLEYIAEKKVKGEGIIIKSVQEEKHPISCASQDLEAQLNLTNQTITQLAIVLFMLRAKVECLEEVNEGPIHGERLSLKGNNSLTKSDDSASDINAIIQNQKTIVETFTVHDPANNDSVESMSKESRLREALNELSEKCKKLTISKEAVDQNESTKSEHKVEKKSLKEEPKENDSLKRRISNEAEIVSASQPILGCDVKGNNIMSYGEKVEKNKLLKSIVKIKRSAPIIIKGPFQEKQQSLDKPYKNDKKLVNINITIATCVESDTRTHTQTDRCQMMEEELRYSNERERKLKEENATAERVVKIVRKKRQVQHDLRRHAPAQGGDDAQR